MTAMPFVYDLSCSPRHRNVREGCSMERLPSTGSTCTLCSTPRAASVSSSSTPSSSHRYNVESARAAPSRGDAEDGPLRVRDRGVPNLNLVPRTCLRQVAVPGTRVGRGEEGVHALLPSGRIIRPCIPSLEQALSRVHAQSLEVPPSDADEGPIVGIIPRSKRRNARFRYGENGNWTDVTNVLGEREAALFNQISA